MWSGVSQHAYPQPNQYGLPTAVPWAQQPQPQPQQQFYNQQQAVAQLAQQQAQQAQAQAQVIQAAQQAQQVQQAQAQAQAQARAQAQQNLMMLQQPAGATVSQQSLQSISSQIDTMKCIIEEKDKMIIQLQKLVLEKDEMIAFLENRLEDAGLDEDEDDYDYDDDYGEEEEDEVAVVEATRETTNGVIVGPSTAAQLPSPPSPAVAAARATTATTTNTNNNEHTTNDDDDDDDNDNDNNNQQQQQKKRKHNYPQNRAIPGHGKKANNNRRSNSDATEQDNNKKKKKKKKTTDLPRNYPAKRQSPRPHLRRKPGGEKYEQKWNKRYEELLEYKKKHGHCNVPCNYPPNKQLGHWVKTQRKCYRYTMGIYDRNNNDNNNITEEDNTTTTNNNNNNDGDYHIFPLPKEQKQQQQQKQTFRITPDKLFKLHKIGFEFDSQQKKREDDAWEIRYRELVRFKAQHGHCLVPKRYQPNLPLACWVQVQRRRYALDNNNMATQGYLKGRLRLPDERIKRLDELGFTWWVGRNGHHTALKEKQQEQQSQELQLVGRGEAPAPAPAPPPATTTTEPIAEAAAVAVTVADNSAAETNGDHGDDDGEEDEDDDEDPVTTLPYAELSD